MPVLAKTLRIKAGRKVELKIEIGHAQIATSIVTVGNKERIEKRRDSFSLDLGAGLPDKTVTCSTMVQDVRQETNHTSVTYTVSNAGTEFCETLDGEARSEGDIVSYVVRFRFRARV